MTRPITILVLSLVLAGCGGELVSSGNWPSNRTLGETGDSVNTVDFRASHRVGDTPGNRFSDYGFRCVVSPQ